MTNEEKIAKAREVHGDKYVYEIEYYKNGNEKCVNIICSEHGLINRHGKKLDMFAHITRKRGCGKCRGKGLSREERIELFREVHGDKYDYSRYVMRRNKDVITIGCPDHGWVTSVTQLDHQRGTGCIYCGGTAPLNTEVFIERAKEIHGDRYDYSAVEYESFSSYVTIICGKHGPFPQKPSDHLSPRNCPHCGAEARASHSQSKNEKRMSKILKHKYPDLKILTGDRTTLGNGWELDIAIPELDFYIEWNGSYWHNKSEIAEKDLWKKEKMGDRLLQIWDDTKSDKRFVIDQFKKIVRPEIERRLQEKREAS